jgi:hypothetical protein
MLVVLAFRMAWMGACWIESTSLVNRSGSGTSPPHDLVRLRRMHCAERLVPFWPVEALGSTGWSGAEEGEDGQHPAVLVG